MSGEVLSNEKTNSRREEFTALAAVFARQFPDRCSPGKTPSLLAAEAPGRVNLIGEHTDYNDGYVLPMAIDRSIKIVGMGRDDGLVRIYSQNYEAVSTFTLDDISYDEQQRWSNYLRGVCSVLQQAGYHLRGADLVVSGDVPAGAGLSSSAALEVATASFLQTVSGFSLDSVELVQLAQRAENEFVGVACGIMDQFISGLGKEGHALFIDCRDLSYKRIPLPEDDVSIVVANSNVKRGLVDSEYNSRRQQCQEGARLLAKWLPGVRALRDVSFAQFQAHRDKLPEIVARRCEHVISENERVLASIDALQAGDAEKFGQLMSQSHASLRDLFEVSCKELDILVEIADQVDGVYGARMTGGGFGGCTVSLVAREQAHELVQVIEREYPKKTGKVADVFAFSPADGARVWQL